MRGPSALPEPARPVASAVPCRPAIEKGEVARAEVEPYHRLRADAAQGRVPAVVGAE